MKSNHISHNLPVLCAILLISVYTPTIAQLCNPAGNVIIYSNYEGGTLNINVNENIPNLKLGIVTYEAPVVNIAGPFAANITEVIYAGFGGDGSCTGNADVQINGVDPSIVTIYTNDQPAISPYLGDPIFQGSPPLVNCITSGGDCSTSSAGGGNSANQIVQFFLFEFNAPAVFRYHSTQYDCWANESVNVSAAGNCCISDPTTPLNPIYQPGATYDLIPETEISLCGGPVTITIPYEVLFQPPVYPGYVWSNGATGATVTFTQPGTYSVTAGDYCHFGVNTLLQDQITITPCSDELSVTITPDQSICPNTSATILASATGGIEPYNYVWDPVIGIGQGPHSVSPGMTAVYSVTVTDAVGTSATVETTVEVVNETIDVELGEDQNLCAGNILLSAANPLAISYLWSTGSTQPSITVSNPGIYSVTVSGECNIATDDITITPCPPQLNVTLGSNQTICPGQQVNLTANATGGLAPYFFIWTPNIGAGPGPFSISPTATTTYTVSVTDAAGATVSASTTITVNTQSVSVNLGPDTDLCNGPVVLNATSPGATAYSWNTGQSTPTITVSNPGTYSVAVTGPCNTSNDQITVGVCIPQLTVSLGPDIVACSGQPFTISAEVSGGTPPYTFSWNPTIANGPGPFTQSVTSNTTYIVTVTDAAGTIAADQLNVTIGASEVSVDLGPDRELCVGVNNELNAFGPNIISYLWSNGSTAQSISPSIGGIYWVIVTGVCNSDTDSIEVVIIPDGLPEFAREVQVCEDSEVLIGPVLPNNYQVVWSTGEFGSQITVDEGGLYTALVATPCGVNTFSVRVETVNCACDIFVPNAFTPDDNNGINDLFGPVSECDFSEYDFTIFNRWGQLVFRTNNPDKKWNGASTDEAYWGRNTVYVWFLKARQRPGLLVTGPIELNGMVTVIR